MLHTQLFSERQKAYWLKEKKTKKETSVCLQCFVSLRMRSRLPWPNVSLRPERRPCPSLYPWHSHCKDPGTCLVFPLSSQKSQWSHTLWVNQYQNRWAPLLWEKDFMLGTWHSRILNYVVGIYYATCCFRCVSQKVNKVAVHTDVHNVLVLLTKGIPNQFCQSLVKPLHFFRHDKSVSYHAFAFMLPQCQQHLKEWLRTEIKPQAVSGKWMLLLIGNSLPGCMKPHKEKHQKHYLMRLVSFCLHDPHRKPQIWDQIQTFLTVRLTCRPNHNCKCRSTA